MFEFSEKFIQLAKQLISQNQQVILITDDNQKIKVEDYHSRWLPNYRYIGTLLKFKIKKLDKIYNCVLQTTPYQNTSLKINNEVIFLKKYQDSLKVLKEKFLENE